MARKMRRRRLLAVLLAMAVPAIGVAVAAPAGRAASAPASVLVVGDSLSVQAAPAVPAWEPPGAHVVVSAGIGTAPCDWANGYYDVWAKRSFQYYQVFDQNRPRSVVFAFSGNAGLSGPAGGCVDATTHYSLEQLLATYTRWLTPMAQYASSHGAAVWFALAPPRNPATPAGAYRDGQGHTYYGFNGVPQINDLYEALAASGTALGWNYDPGAAAGVSAPGLTWALDLPCKPWDGLDCHNGMVQVRAGGFDAIHLDRQGAGGIRFALGLMRLPLTAEGYHPRA